ncbi:MAG TPA: hypothetical protein VKS22_09230 [Candidatus Binataceae bacterium]|nr:hypothetical protein [Candidatus Binataceae bacterium]
MKEFFAALCGILMLAASARAGVVVEEQQVSDRGGGAPITHKIVVMVQGNKQKSVIDDVKQSLIIDLDQGMRMMISDARKMYVEVPFPSKGMPKGPNPTAISFKKTGGTQTLAGYSCDEYTGAGSMNGNDMTIVGCFSSSAPGAQVFTNFQKAMADKVKGTPMALMSDSPPGIPLKIDTTMKVTHMSMPGLTPQQMEEMNKRLAGRPPTVIHMTVTKVTEENLAADTFQPPKGYTKQQMPMMAPGMMGARPPMGAAPGAMGQRPGSGAPVFGLPPQAPATPAGKVPE